MNDTLSSVLTNYFKVFQYMNRPKGIENEYYSPGLKFWEFSQYNATWKYDPGRRKIKSAF